MIAPVNMPEGVGMEYLGPEFLTWLWWRSDVEPGFKHASGDEVYVHFDDHLEFRGERSAARRTVLRAGMPGASMEARAALRSGKSLTAARILLAHGEDEVRFTLRAETMAISSLRLPAPEGDTREARLAASFESQEQFLGDLDLCLTAFLRVRCSDAWEAEAARIRTWGAAPSPDERMVTATPPADRASVAETPARPSAQ